MKKDLNKLKAIPEFCQGGDWISKCAQSHNATSFCEAINEGEIQRYKDNTDLIREDMKELYGKLGKYWWQRVRQGVALQQYAQMLDGGADKEVAATAAHDFAIKWKQYG